MTVWALIWSLRRGTQESTEWHACSCTPSRGQGWRFVSSRRSICCLLCRANEVFAEQTKKTSEEIKRRADQAGVQDTDRCRPHDIIRTDPQCGFIRHIHNAEAVYRSVATHIVAEQEGHRRYLVLIPERVMGLNQRLERIRPTFGCGPLKMTDSSVYWLA